MFASPAAPCLALPINRCNLPASILGGLTFQRAPTALAIDGAAALHRPLFDLLDHIGEREERGARFVGYMKGHFRLARPPEAGLGSRPAKIRGSVPATCASCAAGLSIPDGREAAVLKGWVESRFGLLPRHHGASLREAGSPAWQHYVAMRAGGAIRHQRAGGATRSAVCLQPVRAGAPVSAAAPTCVCIAASIDWVDHELIADDDPHGGPQPVSASNSASRTVLLNNVSSFSRSPERAGEFGDTILSVDVPLPKLAFFSELLPGMLKAEDEHVVIGGLYRVRLARL